MIKKINYRGKFITCDVKPDYLIISLISIPLVIVPVWFFFMGTAMHYTLAVIIHFAALMGIVGSQGTVLLNIKPVKEQEG